MSEKDACFDASGLHPEKVQPPTLGNLFSDALGAAIKANGECVWPFNTASRGNHAADTASFKIGSTKVEVTKNKTAQLTYSDGRKRTLEFDGTQLTKVTEPDGQTWTRVGDKDEWVLNGKEHWQGHIRVDSHEINYKGLDGYSRWAGHDGAQGLVAQKVNICDLKDEYRNIYALLNQNNNNTLEKEELSVAFTDKSLTAQQAQVIAALYENFDSLVKLSNDDNGKDAGISPSDIFTFAQQLIPFDRSVNVRMLDEFAKHEFGFKAADSQTKDGYLTIDEISDYLQKSGRSPANSNYGNGLDRATKPLTDDGIEQSPLETLRLNFDQIKNAFDEKSPDSSKGISQNDLETYLTKTCESLNKEVQLEDNLALSLKLTRKDLEHSQGKLSLSELSGLRDKLQLDLTKKYAVNFSKDGESASYLIRRSRPDKAHKTTNEYSPDIATRSPRWFELDAVEQALKRVQPSQFVNERREAVKFHFLKSSARDQTNVLALTSLDKAGRSAIYFNPEYLNALPTVKAARLAHFDIRSSMEYTTIHELAHNSQRRLGWEPLSNVERETSAQMGWKLIESGNRGAWVLPGKDGKLYQHLNYLTWDKWDNQKDLESFRNNPDHMYDIIAAGKKLPFNIVDWREVTKHVPIKPITHYFDHPAEMHAEGLTYYRLGGDYRAELAEKTPALYNIVKSNDQTEINLAYPPTIKGQARFIRGTHGFLVPNTAENLKIVSDFENKHLTKSTRIPETPTKR